MRLWALGKLQTSESDEHTTTPDEELDESAAAFGMRVEQSSLPDEQVFHLFPESLPSWLLWTTLQTQWRTAGMEGERTGLDYAGVEAYMRAMGYGPGKRRSMRRALADVQAMEVAAMNAWSEVRRRKAGSRRG